MDIWRSQMLLGPEAEFEALNEATVPNSARFSQVRIELDPTDLATLQSFIRMGTDEVEVCERHAVTKD